jgi:hypothetical protein
MKLPVPGRVRVSFNKMWIRLTRRQRQTLTALGMANLIALSALVVFLLRAPSPSPGAPGTSPLNPQRLEACRQEASHALFDAGQTGIVQTQADGTILLQLQRPTTPASLRLDADAAIWAALETMAVASRGSCLGFDALQVTVVLQPPAAEPTRATARVALSNLLLWSWGEIDDAELTLRVHYQPPATHTPSLTR